MDTNQLFSIGLGIEAPWRIVTSHLDVNVNPHRLDLRIEAERGALYPCPDCGRPCKAHGFAGRTRRHLNFFQRHCYATAPVPRTGCPEHGVKTISVPWARKGSAFTMFFEAMVMLLAREMPVLALVSKAIDEVRRAEAKRTPLPKHLRYAILKNPATKMTEEQEQALYDPENSNLATAQAYRCKESLAWVREAQSHQGAAWRMTVFVK